MGKRTKELSEHNPSMDKDEYEIAFHSGINHQFVHRRDHPQQFASLVEVLAPSTAVDV